MGRQWSPGQAKKFARDVVLGRKYYTVQDQATNLAPYEDPQTYSVHVFTGHSRLTGVPMTDGGTSAIQLCRGGPVYDSVPRNVRPVAGPAPQHGSSALKAGGKARGWWR